MKKAKTIWLLLDGKKHCDVVMWALAANMMVADAKKHFIEYYGDIHEVSFKVV
jgi:hypothetical protein